MLLIGIAVVISCRTFSSGHIYACGEMHTEAGWWVQAHAKPGYRTLVNILRVHHVSGVLSVLSIPVPDYVCVGTCS